MEIFGQTITDEAGLREVYHEPSGIVKAKKFTRLDGQFREFVALAPFCIVATTGADGSIDASPRGGPPGFVRVVDDRHLALPDLSGNNLLDSIGNVVATGSIGLLFMVPGEDETVRVNGRACVTVDPDILSLWEGELRRPKVAVGIEVVEVFNHCPKAFRRGGLWDPQSWPDPSTVPDFCETYADRFATPPAAELRSLLETDYTAVLAAEHARAIELFGRPEVSAPDDVDQPTS